MHTAKNTKYAENLDNLFQRGRKTEETFESSRETQEE